MPRETPFSFLKRWKAMTRSERHEGHEPVGKPADEHRFLLVLVILTAANLIFFVAGFARELANRNGLQIDPVSPLGGDFINLWTAGKLLVAGAVGTIYDPAAFKAFQQGFVHADIGARLGPILHTRFFSPGRSALSAI
ncbi:hypothetical protein [Mesorhizobium sp. A556]